MHNIKEIKLKNSEGTELVTKKQTLYGYKKFFVNTGNKINIYKQMILHTKRSNTKIWKFLTETANLEDDVILIVDEFEELKRKALKEKESIIEKKLKSALDIKDFILFLNYKGADVTNMYYEYIGRIQSDDVPHRNTNNQHVETAIEEL
jgi:hypothetical protein